MIARLLQALRVWWIGTPTDSTGAQPGNTITGIRAISARVAITRIKIRCQELRVQMRVCPLNDTKQFAALSHAYDQELEKFDALEREYFG